MFSLRLKFCAFTAVTVLSATAAQAADLYLPPPPQPAPEFTEGWYLRGFVGVGMAGQAKLDYSTVTNATLQTNNNDDMTFMGAAVGYDFNNWLRFDVSGEYRTKSRLYAFVTYPPGGIDEYQGYLKSAVFLANAFVDLGTWNCFTPFFGAGIGTALNTLSDFTDVNPNGGFGFGRNPSQWNLAYAFYAGLGYNVTKDLKVDLTYRYLNYGSITDTVDCNVTCTHDSFKFGNLYSNDIMLGLRWTCCEAPRYVEEPPIRSKG
jgi:opacity protein-like surface antigen